MEKVALVRSTYEDVNQSLTRAIDFVGGMKLHSGQVVAIKINMCDARPPETGTITHPIFLDALLKYLRENYEDLDIYVVESDATVVLADEFIKWFGYMPIIEKWGAKWHNLSRDKIVNVKIRGNYLKSVPVPKLLNYAKLISLSKLKTNSLSKITCSLKNQFGCLPMRGKAVFHNHLAEVIVDANLAMKPSFSIVDGIIAMGGSGGPSFGKPIYANVILTSKDPVAVDSACAVIIGYKPKRVKHIRLAEKAHLGSIFHNLVGDKVSIPDFELDLLSAYEANLGRMVKALMRVTSRYSWRKEK